MNILVDTHALFWFFTADKKISKRAKINIENSEKIFIPTIVLLELVHLLIKKRQEYIFPVIYSEFKKRDKYVIVSLDIAVIDIFMNLSKDIEMHDRIIVATAILCNAVVVTKDKIIQKAYKNTLW